MTVTCATCGACLEVTGPLPALHLRPGGPCGPLAPLVSEHYVYRTTGGRSGRKVYAKLNEGHTGSVLSCPHPDCVALRR